MLQGQPISSLPLQIMIYFDTLYSWVYLVLSLGLFFYKGYTLTYPPNALGPEVVGLIFFIILQLFRLFIGSVGNRTETAASTLWFLLLTLPSIFASVFFIRLQTYVLVADVIINIILLFFMGLEFILSIITFLKFKSAEKTR